MAKYTAENIARIVANGDLASYTQMEADLIGKLDGANLVDDAAEGRMTLAYMYGTYAAWLEQDGTYTATVDTSYGPVDKSWTGFASENAARQYARANSPRTAPTFGRPSSSPIWRGSKLRRGMPSGTLRRRHPTMAG